MARKRRRSAAERDRPVPASLAGTGRRPPRVSAAAGLALLAGAAAGCCAITWLATRPGPDTGKAWPYVATHLELFAVYLGGLRWLSRTGWSPQRRVAAVLASAVLLRLLLLPGPPLLDDDIYRYRWDGKLLASGVNPYRYAPADPALERFRLGDPLVERIGFADVPTVYPPLSQLLFAAGYALDPEGIAGLKALFALCDLGAILALMGLLRALGRPAEDAAVYAWCPVVLKEFANSGHHDAAGIAMLVLGLWAAACGRGALSAALGGLSALVKPVAVQLLPGLANRMRWRDAAIFAGVAAVAVAPFASVGAERLWAGTALYLRHWEKNDSLFAIVQALFGGPVATGTPGFTHETHPGARAVALAAWVATAAWALWDTRRERRENATLPGGRRAGFERTLRRVAVLLAVMLLTTPTMNPWYLAWLVPFLCFFRWHSWILLTGTCGLSYLFDWQGRDLWWIRPLEYGPFFVLLVAGYAASALRRGRWFSRPSRRVRDARS